MNDNYAVEANEVFKAFGYCAHHAQTFEAELLNLMLVIAQMTGKAVTTAELIEMENTPRTMGQLLRKLAEIPGLKVQRPPEWDIALEKRNYLFHRFFYESAFRLFTKDGCFLLVNELQEMAIIFEKAGGVARANIQLIIELLGISYEEWQRMWEAEYHRLFDEAKDSTQ